MKKEGGSGGSDGAVVSVWLAGPSGEMFPAEPIERETSTEPTAKAPTERPHDKVPPAFDGPKSKGGGSGTGGLEGSGLGKGSGSGIGDGDEGDTVLANIWKKIDQKKYYPSIARRHGIEGTPKVSFEIGGDGSVKWVKLISSCGYAMLDDAALITVQRAAPLPFYPTPVTLSVRYTIDR